MFQLSASNRIIFLGIFIVIAQAFFGASFDANTKFLGSNNTLNWYHYYGLGLGFSLFLFIIYLFLIGGIKKHIFFKNKKHYVLPLLRGFTFIPVPIIIYYVLQQIPLSIFTPIIMTTPFFVLIWSSILQKEVIAFKYWLILIIGFSGTIFVAKPTFFQTNPLIFLIFLVAAYNALTSVIVSKYSSSASTFGYTFYNLLPLTIFCLLLFIIDPIVLVGSELIFVFSGGILLFIAALLLTLVFHVSGNFTRIISPFFFSQLIWSSFFGIIFFNEKLDFFSIFGLILIVFSGSLTAINTPK